MLILPLHQSYFHSNCCPPLPPLLCQASQRAVQTRCFWFSPIVVKNQLPHTLLGVLRLHSTKIVLTEIKNGIYINTYSDRCFVGLILTHSSFWGVDHFGFFLNLSLDNAIHAITQSPFCAEASKFKSLGLVSPLSSALHIDLYFAVIIFGCLKAISSSTYPKLHSWSLLKTLSWPITFTNQKPKVQVWRLPHPPCPVHHQVLLILFLKYLFNWPTSLYFCTQPSSMSFHMSHIYRLNRWNNLLTGLPVIYTTYSPLIPLLEQPR